MVGGMFCISRRLSSGSGFDGSGGRYTDVLDDIGGALNGVCTDFVTYAEGIGFNISHAKSVDCVTGKVKSLAIVMAELLYENKDHPMTASEIIRLDCSSSPLYCANPPASQWPSSAQMFHGPCRDYPDAVRWVHLKASPRKNHHHRGLTL